LKDTIRAILAAGAIIAATLLIGSAVKADESLAPPTVKVRIDGGSGSGFHIGGGTFVTAAHVVEGQETVKIEFSPDGKNYVQEPATVVKVDPAADVAVLSVEKFEAVSATSLDCREPVVGEPVRAVGNPLGDFNVTTFGFVSRAPGNYPDSDAGLVILDLTLAPGMSGGPIFDADGEVIAVSNAVLATGTAIPGIAEVYPIALGVPSTEVCRVLPVS
jgi:S1-C subfamily serine protease